MIMPLVPKAAIRIINRQPLLKLSHVHRLKKPNATRLITMKIKRPARKNVI